MDVEFCEKLINEVQLNEMLFNKRHPFYFHKVEKAKCWSVISIKLGKTVEECQKKWKVLRERFVKECRKNEQPSGSGASTTEPWLFFESMAFLKNFVREKKTRCNEIFDDNIYPQDVSEVSFTDDQLPLSSRKPTEKKSLADAIQSIEEAATAIKNQTSTEYNNAFSTDECFCRALVSLVKEFPEDKKDEARKKLFMLVMQLKEEYRT